MKLSDIQLNKVKSPAKSDMIGTDESNFLHDLLLTNRQFASLCKAFANNPPKYKIKNSTVKNNTVGCIPW